MKYFKQLDLPTFDNLLADLDYMLDQKLISWGVHNQICLNTIPDQPDNYAFGTASLGYDWEKSATVVDERGIAKIVVPRREVQIKEEDFTVLCSQFKNTRFEQIYNVLSENFNVGRVRLMKSAPKSCLTWHVDSTKRVHYPILTQEGCFMVIEDEILHLAQDSWYFTETLVGHTAFNGSMSSRIHIVACIL